MSSEKHIMKRKKVPFLSFVLLGILIMGCVFVPFFCKDASYMDLMNCSRAPGREFFFGTDTMGRDLIFMYMAWRTCFSYHWLFVCCHISSYCSFVWHSKCTVTCVAGSAFDAVSRRASFCSVAFACLICAGSIWKKYHRNECSDWTLRMVFNGKNRAHTGKNSKRKRLCHGIAVYGRRLFSCALLASCPKFSSIHFIYDYYECTNSNS